MSTTTEMKDCAFQYAYKGFGGVKIVEDTGLISLEEAKDLFNKYLPDFMSKLEKEMNPEMAIWIEMKEEFNYNKTLVHLDSSYETDGKDVWKTKKEYVTDLLQSLK